MKATGSKIIIQMLKMQGIDIITGIPGGANLPLYDTLSKSGIRHILARHEQGCGFIAQGMARSTGKPAVVFVTSGPGATNLLTALADARLDSVPIIAFTGQVPLSMMGKDAFQEVDTYGMSIPFTKHSFLVRNAEELLRVIPLAFDIARGGRPGPVLIDVPVDIQRQEVEFDRWPEPLPNENKETPDTSTIQKAAEKINSAERPIIMAGGGIISSGTSEQLRDLAETAGIPVVTTLMGLGTMDHKSPLNLGMPGMHGSPAVNNILNKADLLIALGIRFDDRAVCRAEKFCPDAEIIHVDIDRAELGKIKNPSLEIHQDLDIFLKELLPHIEKKRCVKWNSYISKTNREMPLWYNDQGDPLHPVSIIRETARLAPDDAIITTDVGQHQMWAAQWYPVSQPRTFLTSGGLGTMGFGLPAAIGAALANPEKTVICFSGDGSLQMNIQELATLAELNLNVKILLFNNRHLGLVRQQQELFYGQNYFASEFSLSPDFRSIARGYGIRGYTFNKDACNPLKKILNFQGPCLADIPINPKYNVMPMVPPGSPHYTMIGEKADDKIETYCK